MAFTAFTYQLAEEEEDEDDGYTGSEDDDDEMQTVVDRTLVGQSRAEHVSSRKPVSSNTHAASP